MGEQRRDCIGWGFLGGVSNSHSAARGRCEGCHPLRVECLEPRQLLAAGPLITELMASNGVTLYDLDGDSPDWFEVHNPTDAPVSLLGYSVTDDPDVLDKWQFSDVTLHPDDYLVAFASGKDRGGDNIRVRVTRDYVATPDGTFLVDLPVGTYTVRLTAGDSAKIRDDVAISLQGNVVDTITTQPGEVVVKSYTADVDAVSGGQLAVRLEDTGGQTGRGVINGLVVTTSGGGESWRFDFGREGSPVEPGYRSVTTRTRYSPAVGYGWEAGVTLSDQDRGQTEGEQHTSYKLSTGGEYLALISAEGEVLSEYGPDGSDYPEQFTDISYGITGTDPGGDAFYFQQPTPGAANDVDSIALGFVDDTSFTVDRGFHDEPFDVEIATTTPGATIVHTTDGSEPTLQNGIAAPAHDADTPPTVSVHIEKTTVLRAAAFKDGYAPTNVDTHTYLFLEDIIEQDVQATRAAGFPSTWNGHAADYGLDPRVIGQNGEDRFGGRYAATIRDDLRSLPTVSLVIDIDDMFGRNGIYAHPESRGIEWERPVSFEMIDPTIGDEFQVNAALRIIGGKSRGEQFKKHGLRLLFKSQYGPPELEVSLFGEDGPDRFDSLILRTMFNDSWAGDDGKHNSAYVRDRWVRQTFMDMGHPATLGHFVHLYINGFYWGLYNLHERPDALFAEMKYGGDQDEYDVFKHPGSDLDNRTDLNLEVVAGTIDAWQTLNSIARTIFAADTDEEKTAIYMRLLGRMPDGTVDPTLETYLDIENFIDYMILNTYVGNVDWGTQNFFAARRRGLESTGYKGIPWDTEFVMGIGHSSLITNRVFHSSGVAEPHGHLRHSDEYRSLFADRIQRHFFHGGVFTPEVAQAGVQQIASEIDRAIVAESARWGDADPLSAMLRTRDDHWLDALDYLMNTYLTQRGDNVLEHFRVASFFPDIDAPEFLINSQLQYGGDIDSGAGLTLDDLGQSEVTIYYMLTGEDPREIGGALSPQALSFQPGVDPPIALDQTTQVKARTRDATGQWSALSEALFVLVAQRGDMNRDGNVDVEDIAALVLGLRSQERYEEQFGVAASVHGDLDGDGDFDFDDIDEFVALIMPAAGAAASSDQASEELNLEGSLAVLANSTDSNPRTTSADLLVKPHVEGDGGQDLLHQRTSRRSLHRATIARDFSANTDSSPQRVTRRSRISSLGPRELDEREDVWREPVDRALEVSSDEL